MHEAPKVIIDALLAMLFPMHQRLARRLSSEAAGKASLVQRALCQVTGFMDIFPGKSIPEKSAIIALASVIATASVAKGIFIVDDDATIVVMSTAIFTCIYKLAKEPVKKFYADIEAGEDEFFLSSWRVFRSTLDAALDKARCLVNYKDYMQQIHQIERENLQTEAEIIFLQQRIAKAKQVSALLEMHLRSQNEADRMEQKAKNEQLLRQLLLEIAKPENVIGILFFLTTSNA